MMRIVLIIGFVFAVNLVHFGQEINSQTQQELQIIKKTAAKYTDRARQNKIEGWVKLQVTFLSTGEIGEVVYQSESSKKKKKLTKFGLVEEAIAAAKQIKFEPARKDGQPITVTKIVIYGFDIY